MENMENSGVNIKIFRNNNCLYEETLKDRDGLRMKRLIEDLKDIQQKSNAFLTTLVEAERNDTVSTRELEDSSESDSDLVDFEEEQINPKKCKMAQ